MTREEAIKCLKGFNLYRASTKYSFADTYEAFSMAIKALEQTSTLDKIRAEIEQVAFKDVNGSKYIFVNRVNQIIDKYIVESEEA